MVEEQKEVKKGRQSKAVKSVERDSSLFEIWRELSDYDKIKLEEYLASSSSIDLYNTVLSNHLTLSFEIPLNLLEANKKTFSLINKRALEIAENNELKVTDELKQLLSLDWFEVSDAPYSHFKKYMNASKNLFEGMSNPEIVSRFIIAFPNIEVKSISDNEISFKFYCEAENIVAISDIREVYRETLYHCVKCPMSYNLNEFIKKNDG